jgi:tellurite resistance protein TerC
MGPAPPRRKDLMQHGPWQWGGFLVFVAVMLALDLGVFHRRAHEVRPREALAWSAVWVGLALGFAGLVWARDGAESGVAFLTGYVIEKSLSVDNIFVFVVLFGALGIPAIHQHRVLFWGILSALVLRGAMIWGGTALLARFHGVVYVFGAFLILTGARLLLHRKEEPHPENSPLYRVVRRVIPSTSRFDGARFFTREGGRRVATPLFVALVLVELSDVVFAVDSIPAIFAVTTDPYLVFTSNIFAILGLRSLYFLLAGAVARFTYLRPSLAAVLMFVGVKMTVVRWVEIPPAVSLVVVTGILSLGVGASLWKARRTARAPGPVLGEQRVEGT